MILGSFSWFTNVEKVSGICKNENLNLPLIFSPDRSGKHFVIKTYFSRCKKATNGSRNFGTFKNCRKTDYFRKTWNGKLDWLLPKKNQIFV
jgi:hypothetical protein